MNTSTETLFTYTKEIFNGKPIASLQEYMYAKS